LFIGYLRPHLKALRMQRLLPSGKTDEEPHFFNKVTTVPDTVLEALSSCTFAFVNLILLLMLNALLCRLSTCSWTVAPEGNARSVCVVLTGVQTAQRPAMLGMADQQAQTDKNNICLSFFSLSFQFPVTSAEQLRITFVI
jgi:hypothetical protein